jgi:hypothetical protein
MSRFEESTYSLGPCPCGAGTIDRYHADMDHGYSTPFYETTISCADCDKRWAIEGKHLVLKESESKYNQLLVELSGALAALKALATPIIVRHVVCREYGGVERQYRELRRLGLVRLGFRAYQQATRQRYFWEVCEPANNTAWLLSRCETPEERAALERVVARLAGLNEAVPDAARSIVRRPL